MGKPILRLRYEERWCPYCGAIVEQVDYDEVKGGNRRQGGHYDGCPDPENRGIPVSEILNNEEYEITNQEKLYPGLGGKEWWEIRQVIFFRGEKNMER